MIRSIGISSQAKKQQKTGTIQALFLLLSLAMSGASLLLLLILTVCYIGLLRKEPPVMVQMVGGESIAMEPMDSQERTPAAIQKFTQDTMTLLLSASGELPGTEGIDEGVLVETNLGERRITTLARLASFGLSEDFRSAFLVELAKQTPPDVFSNAQTQVVLVVQNISHPEEIAEGEWKVSMIANLVTVSRDYPQGRPVPWNKDIFIRAVTPQRVQSYSSELEQQIGEVRQSGLEIHAIRNYTPTTFRPGMVSPQEPEAAGLE